MLLFYYKYNKKLAIFNEYNCTHFICIDCYLFICDCVKLHNPITP